MTNKTNILFIGEAMLELSSNTQENMQDTLKKSFAGDVYNTSVYIKRAFPNNEISFMSGLGQEPLSLEFEKTVVSEGIDTSYIAHSAHKHMGIYMVLNDEHGERSFIYWRNNSAAKQMMSLLDSAKQNAALEQFQHIFFSGITLAILDSAERGTFWRFINDAKQRGISIIFDPNYRPSLWNSPEAAKQQFALAYAASDWLLPGMDDFKALYDIHSIDECIAFCRPFDFTEVLIKQGGDPVHLICRENNTEQTQSFAIERSKNVVDTTSAGDAFNGIYIGARIEGKSPAEAVKLANYAAMKVIETQGAIMPKTKFMEVMSQY